MTVWRETKLENLLLFSNGRTSPKRDSTGDVPVYGSNGIIGFSSESNSPANTIVIGRVGSYCGSLYLSRQKCWVTDNAIRANIKDDNDPSFLYFLLTTLNLNDKRAGSGQPLLNQSILNTISVRVPPAPLQKVIAKILSAFDNKIALNRRMNATMEAIALALFKAWFVDFEPVRANMEHRPSESAPPEVAKLFPAEFENGVPKGWARKKVNRTASRIQYGFTQSSTYEKVGPKFLRITDIQGGKIEWEQVPYCVINDSDFKKYEVREHDIFIARTGASTGENVYVIDSPTAVFASYLIRVQFDDPILAFYFGKFFRSDNYFDYVESILGGSAQPNANAQELTNIEAIVPDHELLKQFFSQLYLLDKQKSANDRENRKLAEIRNLVLPRLISGKINVNEDKNDITEEIG